ncbi:hypothetical protein DFJ77DRAFT_365616 [Powellomyces hirtus]|nr:hypothetical protein DFJ77DRAFT_365616 [Powellomyces hirtus]
MTMITDCHVCHEPRFAALDEPLYKSCAIAMGAMWVTCYVAMAFKNYKDKSYGMPMLCLCLNLSWEFIMTVIHPVIIPDVWYASVLWVLFDLILLYQTYIYAPNEFRDQPFLQKRTTFMIVAGIAAGLPGIIFFLDYAHDVRLGLLAGLVLNTALAISYVAMLISRKSSRGQSLLIAASKGLGSTAAWVLNIGLGFDHKFLLYLYVLNMATDAVYTTALYMVIQREKKDIAKTSGASRTSGKKSL